MVENEHFETQAKVKSNTLVRKDFKCRCVRRTDGHHPLRGARICKNARRNSKEIGVKSQSRNPWGNLGSRSRTKPGTVDQQEHEIHHSSQGNLSATNLQEPVLKSHITINQPREKNPQAFDLADKIDRRESNNQTSNRKNNFKYQSNSHRKPSSEPIQPDLWS